MSTITPRSGRPDADRHERTGPESPRTVRPRRALLGPRAVVGGLLVAVAMVGTLATYSTAGDAPTDRVLVVHEDVRAGERLSASNVSQAAAELPPSTRSAVLDADADLAGAVALAPLRAGDVLQKSAVFLPDDADPDGAPRREFSLPVERDRALNGDIARGETVDMLATYGTGESAYTVTVARRARVVDVTETTGGLGSDGRVVVVIALDDAEAVLRVTHASVAAVVTLVRATGATGDVTDRYPAVTLDSGRR